MGVVISLRGFGDYNHWSIPFKSQETFQEKSQEDEK